MPTKLNPYISFTDNARQAMEFYHSVFGGDLRMQTFKDYHASQDPSEDDLIMHAELADPNGLTLMASDTPNRLRMAYVPGTNVSMSLSGDNDSGERLQSVFKKLSAGGKVTMPLEKAMWGDMFGMCTDKFGINWLVNIAAPKM